MAQRRIQKLSGRPRHCRVAGLDVVRKDVVADVEFGDVDVDAKISQGVQELVEPCRIVLVLRLQMALQANGVEPDAGVLEVGNQLQEATANGQAKFVVALRLRLVQYEFGGAVGQRGAFEG